MENSVSRSNVGLAIGLPQEVSLGCAQLVGSFLTNIIQMCMKVELCLPGAPCIFEGLLPSRSLPSSSPTATIAKQIHTGNMFPETARDNLVTALEQTSLIGVPLRRKS